MELKLKMEMDNSAFDQESAAGCNGGEAARILRALADKIDGVALHHEDSYSLRDINGNKVGEAEVEGEEEDDDDDEGRPVREWSLRDAGRNEDGSGESYAERNA